MSALLLLKAETQRRETRLSEYVQNISGIVRNQLDTNEAVLAGFSAFLQAVDQSDTEAAARYAAAVMSAYPHLYMLEAARAVPVAEQAAFEALLRRTWRPDFTLKDFPTLTRQPARHQAFLRETWPVLFMYPRPMRSTASGWKPSVICPMRWPAPTTIPSRWSRRCSPCTRAAMRSF